MTQEVGNEILDKYETLYNWCLVNNIKPNNITDEYAFMVIKINYSEFLEFLKDGDYQKDTPPNKPEKYLELRMNSYGISFEVRN